MKKQLVRLACFAALGGCPILLGEFLLHVLGSAEVLARCFKTGDSPPGGEYCKELRVRIMSAGLQNS